MLGRPDGIAGLAAPPTVFAVLGTGAEDHRARTNELPLDEQDALHTPAGAWLLGQALEALQPAAVHMSQPGARRMRWRRRPTAMSIRRLRWLCCPADMCEIQLATPHGVKRQRRPAWRNIVADDRHLDFAMESL